jgi:hypothetical protein
MMEGMNFRAIGLAVKPDLVHIGRRNDVDNRNPDVHLELNRIAHAEKY